MNNRLVVKNHPKSPISESYRAIRSNIQFANIDGDTKTIMITSSMPGEGKSTTIANVALAMADAGYRVLLMDCDFRKPMIHKKFRLRNNIGLTDILLEKMDYREYTQVPEGTMIDVITSGRIPQNPSEIVGSHAMQSFIEKVKEDYDYVFIDAPPATLVTDPVLLGNIVDGVLLVISSGTTHIESAVKAKENLMNARAKLLGAILNKVEINASNAHYYTYYYGDKDKLRIKNKKQKRK